MTAWWHGLRVKSSHRNELSEELRMGRTKAPRAFPARFLAAALVDALEEFRPRPLKCDDWIRMPCGPFSAGNVTIFPIVTPNGCLGSRARLWRRSETSRTAGRRNPRRLFRGAYVSLFLTDCYPGFSAVALWYNSHLIKDLRLFELQGVARRRVTVHLGAGGRWFESSRPDQNLRSILSG
jgi:hypothetical protein